MPLHGWRRLHGTDVVAQVEPIAGLGVWEVSVWLTTNPTGIVRMPRPIELLMSAQAKADNLARKTFDHECAVANCGEWLPIQL